ncbi:MAG: dihydrolipoyl dehydrogenase [Myxococcota bacterium]
MSTKDIQIPDIGDFDDVPVVEILVQPGDTVEPEQPLLTLESDKASMDVPAPEAGTITEILVKVGDAVKEGVVIARFTPSGGAPAAETPAPKSAPAPTPAAPSPAPAPSPRPSNGAIQKGDVHAAVVVLGSGPGGYTAAFRAADLGLDTVLIERWDSLGGVCLNVGCIPSKALLHAAKVITEAEEMSEFGLKFAKPTIDIDKLRGWKDKVVGRLTGGVEGLAKRRKVRTVQGTGTFIGPHLLEVVHGDQKTTVSFEQCIVAAGSEAVRLPFFPWDDERVVDSTGALELRDIPERFLVVGGGIIGLEMACVYDALGSAVTVVELMDGLMPGADRDIVRPLQRRLDKRLAAVRLKTKVTACVGKTDGLEVTFEDEKGEVVKETFDRVLVAVGRSPNGKVIGLDAAGVKVDERGYVPVDNQLRTNVPHIFAIGDIVGQPMLAHKATHEGKTAAEAAAGEKSYFDARVIPSVAYTDPEVAWVGVTETEAKAKNIPYEKGSFPWAASGRSLSMARDEGMTKILFDPDTHRVIGAGIVGTQAGDLIAELCLAIEMGADAADVGMTIHPHPTLSESVGMSAEAFEGTITDLYLPKKKSQRG